MYRLLIVDDEPIIADGLKDTLLSNENFTELDIHTCYSSLDALGFMSRMRIDIVISDIKMPGTSGIKLAQTISQRWPLCQVIFLTGFKQADYAISAIKCNVADYILKTESDDALFSAVNKAVHNINQSHSLSGSESIGISEFIRSAFIRDMMFSITKSGGTNLRSIFKGTEIVPDLPVITVIGKTAEYDLETTVTLITHVDSLIGKYISNLFSRCFFLNGNIPVWIFQEKENLDYSLGNETASVPYVKDTLEIIQELLFNKYGKKITFAVSSKCTPLSSFLENYCVLENLLERGSVVFDGAILTEQSIDISDKFIENSYSKFSDLVAEWEYHIPHLKKYLSSGYRDEFFNLINKMTLPFDSTKYISSPVVIEFYYTIVNELIHFVNINKLFEQISFKVNLLEITDISHFPSWQEAKSALLHAADIIFETANSGDREISSQIIRRLKEYIQTHLDGDLSLNALSDMAGLNPFYLSRYFKQFEKMNISSYIEKMKMEKAAVLLKNTDLKILEIAESLGFTTSSYFSIRFRKQFKISPQEYRLKYSR